MTDSMPYAELQQQVGSMAWNRTCSAKNLAPALLTAKTRSHSALHKSGYLVLATAKKGAEPQQVDEGCHAMTEAFMLVLEWTYVLRCLESKISNRKYSIYDM